MYDDGPEAGLGHRRRMAALGSELRAQGASAEMLPILAATTPPVAADVVVIDSYTVRARRTMTRAPLVAVDDLDRDLDVDVIVDPSPGGGVASRGCRRVLAGPRYALLDGRGPAATQPEGPVRTVLVTLGASTQAASAVHLADELADGPWSVTVVQGPWSRFHPKKAEVVVAPDGLHDLLVSADIVVTGGGVTLLESLHLGRPTVALVVADNQRRAVEAAAGAGACLQADLASASASVHALAADLTARQRLANAGRSLVDGRGAERVAAEVLRLVA